MREKNSGKWYNYGLRVQNENYFRFLFLWGRHVSKDQYLANVPL